MNWPPPQLPQENHILLEYFLVARNRTSFELVEARTRCTIAILRYFREFKSSLKKNQAFQGAEYCTGFRSHAITSNCLFFYFFVLWWEIPIAWTPFTVGLSSHEHSNWPAGARWPVRLGWSAHHFPFLHSALTASSQKENLILKVTNEKREGTMVIIWPLGSFSKLEEEEKEAAGPDKQPKSPPAFSRHCWVWWGSKGTQVLDCTYLCSLEVWLPFPQVPPHILSTFWMRDQESIPVWTVHWRYPMVLGTPCATLELNLYIWNIEGNLTWLLPDISVIGVSVSVFITLLIPNPTCVTLCGQLPKCILGLWQGTRTSFEDTCYPPSEWGQSLEIPLKPHFSFGWSWKLQLYALCFPGITEWKSKASDCI